MSRAEVADRIAARFNSRFLQGYVRSKVRTDPVYEAVRVRLQGHEHPLVDVGCGIGLLPLYLREHGYSAPIVGLDFDRRKIDSAPQIDGVTFRSGDAREPLPQEHSVVMLDLLHYFTTGEQRAILANAARAVPRGGVVIIRDAVNDGSWRYRATYLAESFARIIAWLKAERLNFPTRATIEAAFAGFEQEIVPLYGRTPFNNYLFVFRRSRD
ncbi:MAG TPA: methyltransferase domain-containing protein [Thermoanaerobaculia bacterium]|nr:methyltransferase domain-containing protein [Thermoanaerobaculia bacterium]